MKAELGAFPKDRQILHKILPLDTPLVLELNSTHTCNFRCNFCIHSSKESPMIAGKPLRKTHMPWDVFELMLEQCKQFPHKIKFCSIVGMGEPLLYPKIIEMVRALKASNAFGILHITTNASLLTKELGEQLIDAGLDELKVSLQGLNAEMYKKITGTTVTFEDIYQNILMFSQIRGDCKLKIKIGDSMLENAGDEQRFYDLFGDICDAIGVEHIFEQWKPNGVSVEPHLVNSDKTLYGYAWHDVEICRGPFTTVEILPDGTFCIAGCHRRFGFEHTIQEVPIVAQWNSEGANQLRRDKLLYGRYSDEVCATCEIPMQNWHPTDLLEGHEQEILERISLKDNSGKI